MSLKSGLEKYKLESIHKTVPYAYAVYVALGFVDSSLADGSLAKFLAIRALFGLPILLVYFYMRKKNEAEVNLVAFISLFSIQVGVALVSRELGGISSDYYFGIIIVSFLQFIFFPFVLIQTMIWDFLSAIFYYVVNTQGIDFDSLLLEKQISNLLSFLLLKFVAINRFNQLFINNYRLIEEEKKFEARARMQKIIGELCHHLNNPMFISMSFTKKICKTQDLDHAKRLAEKSLEAQERMNKVTKEMLKIYDGKESHFDQEI
ncbi:MAG: hypothetical protein Fur0010_06210 [Bdellovibrio sp.]